MAGRQQRDRRRVQGRGVSLRPQGSAGRGSGTRSLSLWGAWSTGHGLHHHTWGSFTCCSLTSLSPSQFNWFCVPMNNFLCSLGVDSCCCQSGLSAPLGHISRAKTRGEQGSHIPTSKISVSLSPPLCCSNGLACHSSGVCLLRIVVLSWKVLC